MSRRGILVAGAGVTGAAVLAACSGGSANTKSADGDAGTEIGSPPTPAPTPASASAPTGSSGATAGSTSSAPAGQALVTLDTLAVGASASVKLANGTPGVVTRTGSASAVCFSAICTHMGCTVKPQGGRFDCPCHGSTFDTRTGKVLGGPAPSPLPPVDVEVSGGAVVEA